MTQESFIPWLSLLVAVASAGVAFYSVSLSRRTAETSRLMERRKATLDFLEEYQRDMREYKDRLLAMGGKDASSLVAEIGKMDFLFVFLNKFEKLAIGLRHEVYDEAVALESLALEIVHVYEFSKPFFEQIGKGTGPENKERVLSILRSWWEKPKPTSRKGRGGAGSCARLSAGFCGGGL